MRVTIGEGARIGNHSHGCGGSRILRSDGGTTVDAIVGDTDSKGDED